jgi:uncharacterized protein (TIGR02284 family)
MENAKSIEVLNTLITINNDRIEGYQTALEETDEQELKGLFSQFSDTSKKCKQELEDEVVELGGIPAEGTMISGKFFRVWMDVKAAITMKDRKAILNSCEYGEDIAVNTYEKVLTDYLSDITEEQAAMIKSQHTLIKADHNEVKLLRDALSKA